MFALPAARGCDPRRWGLAGAACFVSLGLLQKHTSLLVAPLFVAAFVAIVVLTERVLGRRPALARWFVWLGWLGAGAGLWLFRATYPEWNFRVDRDEALDLALRGLLAGHYPYAARTQLDNPISPLPGSFLLALPFVLVSSSAYQNFGWGALALLFVGWRFGWDKAAVAMVSGFACLAVAQEWLFGGDLITLSLCSAAAVGAVVASVERRRMQPWAALALGIALTSRPNMAFVLLSLLLWAWRTRRLRVVSPVLAGAALVEGALVAGFYLWSPEDFSPLHLVHKLDHGAAGNLTFLVLPIMALTSVVLGVVRGGGASGSARLFMELGLVQAVPLVIMVVSQSWSEGALTFAFLKERYGVVPFLFCLTAFVVAESSAGFPVPALRSARKVSDPEDSAKVEHARTPH